MSLNGDDVQEFNISELLDDDGNIVDLEGIASLGLEDVLLDDDIAAYSPKGRYGYNPDRLERYAVLEEEDNE
jgi:hypothetical protein